MITTQCNDYPYLNCCSFSGVLPLFLSAVFITYKFGNKSEKFLPCLLSGVHQCQAGVHYSV